MIVKLYKCNAPVNKRVKSTSGDNPELTDEIKITDAQFITENNKKNPSFRVVSASDLTPYNYAVLPVYSRQYFATVTNIAVGVYLVECRFDVLSSVADQLATLACTVNRSASDGSPYLYDDLYKCQNYKLYATKEFPNGLTDSSYILMTVGTNTTP